MQATEEFSSQDIPRPENRTYDDPEDPLWAIYNRETEKVDRALVERCNENMNGLLIFAGLFSAVITAFIIESYKSLKPDSGDTSVALLGQISLQLAAMANGSQYALPDPSAANTTFTATQSAVRVNACWFISLSLSLATALAATLVQQWARYYLQAINRREVPRIRARIRSFLYTGVKSFRLLAIVDAIPALLHISVFVFLAGLVEFLSPLNATVGFIVLAILALLGALYAVISVLPVFRRDCPYSSPFTAACWGMLKYVHLSWCWLHSSWTFRRTSVSGSSLDVQEDGRSLPKGWRRRTTLRELAHRLAERGRSGLRRSRSATVEACVRAIRHLSLAGQNSFAEAQEADALSLEGGRRTREAAALRWTLDSLTDHSELAPFLRALPGYADKHYADERYMTDEDQWIMRMSCLERLFGDLTNRAGRLLDSYDYGDIPRPHQMQHIKAAMDTVGIYAQLERRVSSESLQTYADVLKRSLLRPLMHFALWRSGVTDIEHHTHCIYLWMLSIPSLFKWLLRKYPLPWPHTPEGLRAFKMLESLDTEDSCLLAGLVLLLYIDYLCAHTEIAEAQISRTTFDRVRTRAFPTSYSTLFACNPTFRRPLLSILTRVAGARGHTVDGNDEQRCRRTPRWIIKALLEICYYMWDEQSCRVTTLALNLILQKEGPDLDVKLEAKQRMDQMIYRQDGFARSRP